jgi:hypothetical protein
MPMLHSAMCSLKKASRPSSASKMPNPPANRQ